MVFEDAVKKVLAFRDERDWEQFHNPKDLAISINLEAAELLEAFQWSGIDLEVEGKREAMAEEDVIAYTIRDNILERMHRKTGDAEFKSWVNSLEYMYKVLNDDNPKNSGVAIEYNLPNTAKRAAACA